MNELYYKFSDYYKKLGFIKRVQKITVNPGFSCPNRDGRISDKGCIFCNNEGFSPSIKNSLLSVTEQISSSIEILKKRYKTDVFTVYFQPFSNTYASLDKLKEAYDSIREFKEISGLFIGTRPDCVNKEIVELINTYTDKYDVWIEYGLQSIHDKTLELINRGHKYADFRNAVELTRKYPKIKTCAHLIIGLPGETQDMIMSTAQEIGKLQLNGVKIHPLHVVRNTVLEEMYTEGKVSVISRDEYVRITACFLEYLSPGTVVQRMTADCPQELLIAPQWIKNKNQIIKAVEDTIRSRNSKQGSKFVKLQ